MNVTRWGWLYLAGAICAGLVFHDLLVRFFNL